MKEGTLVQVHNNEALDDCSQLANLDHQVCMKIWHARF
jgi:hypothetical protein